MGWFPNVKPGQSKHFIFISSPSNDPPGQSLTNMSPFIALWPLLEAVGVRRITSWRYVRITWLLWLRFELCDINYLSVTQRGLALSSHVYRKSEKQTNIVEKSIGRGSRSVLTFTVCLSCWCQWGCTRLSAAPLSIKKCHCVPNAVGDDTILHCKTI